MDKTRPFFFLRIWYGPICRSGFR